MQMVDVIISVSLAADANTTEAQVRDFINNAIAAALEAQPPAEAKFAFNDEPFQGWTTA